MNSLDLLALETGAFYLMDRGYLDFARLHRMHEAGSFFVTRSKRNTLLARRYSHEVVRENTRVVCGQT